VGDDGYSWSRSGRRGYWRPRRIVRLAAAGKILWTASALRYRSTPLGTLRFGLGICRSLAAAHGLDDGCWRSDARRHHPVLHDAHAAAWTGSGHERAYTATVASGAGCAAAS